MHRYYYPHRSFDTRREEEGKGHKRHSTMQSTTEKNNREIKNKKKHSPKSTFSYYHLLTLVAI